MQQLYTLGNNNALVDFASNQLTFLDSRFYRTANRGFVPSVTTYLEAFPKSAQFYDWLKKVGENADDIRDEAGRKGSVVHGLTEAYDKGQEVRLTDNLGKIDKKLGEWKMFERYVEFRSRHAMEIELIEANLVSEALGMGGTLDRVVKMDGKLILLDIKTSNVIHDHYWLQLAAYDQMLREHQIRVDAHAILWLNAKTKTYGKGDAIQGPGWQMLTETDPAKMQQSWDMFQACKKLWLYCNGDQKPCETAYKLSHKKAV